MDRITSSPCVMVGKPCVRGTRITVQCILEHLAAGESPTTLCIEYPSLTVPDIQAAVEYAIAAIQPQPLQQAG